MKRIFISSTFKDMQEERDLFHSVIAPDLNTFASHYGESVSFCDLRWGVNTEKLDEAETSRKVLSVCLNEIDRCDRSGSMPYVIVLLGDRYGSSVKSDEINFIAGQKHFSVGGVDEMSVTELEITYGALRDEHHLSRTLFYFREFENKVPPTSAYAPDNPEDAERIRILKSKIDAELEKYSRKVHTYKARLSEDGTRIEGLESFAEQVFNDVCALMQKEWEDYARLSSHEKLARLQWNIADQKESQFGARENKVNEIVAAVKRSPSLISLRGKTGSGKSTLMSRLAYSFRALGNDTVPIFCGSHSELNDSLDVLRYIIYELESRVSVPHIDDAEHPSPLTVEKYREALSELLKKYKGQRLVFLIDALDQLADDEGREKLIFLPRELKENVSFVVSSLDTFKVFEDVMPSYTSVTLSKLSQKEITVSIHSILNFLGRELERRVISAISDKEESTNPLYLSLLIQRLTMMNRDDFSSMTSDSRRIKHKLAVIREMSGSVEDACYDIVCEASHLIGGDLARTALEYVALSQSGLRESDLEALLNTAGLTWNQLDFSRLVSYLQGFFIFKDDGRVDFTHKSIRQGIRLHCRDAQKKHADILKHLETLNADAPLRIDETVYQCYASGDTDSMLRYVENVMSDGTVASARSVAKSVHDTVNAHGHEWFSSVFDKTHGKEPEDSFYRFLCEYLKPYFSRESKKLSVFIKIMQRAAAKRAEKTSGADRESLGVMGEISFCIACCFYELSKHDLAEQYIFEAIEFFKLQKKKDESFDMLTLSGAYNMCGLILDGEKKYTESLKYFKLSLEIDKELGIENASMATAYHNIAYYYYNLSDYENALENEKRAISILERCFAESERDNAANMILFYRRISAVFKAIGDTESAVSFADKALSIAQKYASIDPDEFSFYLALSYNDKGFALSGTNHKLSVDCYEKAIAIFKRYASKKPETVESELASAYCNLASQYHSNGDHSLSERAFVQGINLREKIYSASSNPQYMLLAVSYNNLGVLYIDMKKYGEARHFFLLAIDVASKAGEEERFSGKQSLVLFYRNAALAFKCLGMRRRASRYEENAKLAESCNTPEMLDVFCTESRKNVFSRTRRKRDESPHAIIKISCVLSFLLIFNIISWISEGLESPFPLFVWGSVAFVMSISAMVLLWHEIAPSKKLGAFLIVSCIASCGIVFGITLPYVISKARSTRQCGEYLKSVNEIRTRIRKRFNAERIRKEIEKLTEKNKVLRSRLVIVKNEALLRKRKKIMIPSIIVGLIAAFELLAFGIVYFGLTGINVSADNDKLIFMFLAFLLPVTVANLIFSIKHIRLVKGLGGAKRFALILVAIFSLFSLTGVASAVLYMREFGSRKSMRILVRILLVMLFVGTNIIYLLIALILPRRKTKAPSFESVFDNYFDFKIHKNNEKINAYQLQLMRLGYKNKLAR